MTVGELIEELRKHPAHHRVFAEYPDGFDYGNPGGPKNAIASVADVHIDEACTVIIDATGGLL